MDKETEIATQSSPKHNIVHDMRRAKDIQSTITRLSVSKLDHQTWTPIYAEFHTLVSMSVRKEPHLTEIFKPYYMNIQDINTELAMGRGTKHYDRISRQLKDLHKDLVEFLKVAQELPPSAPAPPISPIPTPASLPNAEFVLRIAELQNKITQLEQDKQALQAELATRQFVRSNNRSEIQTDLPGTRNNLETSLREGKLPTVLQTFIKNLLVLAKEVENDQWKPDDTSLDKLDHFVYTPPSSLLRLRLETSDVKLADIIPVLVLQQHVHTMLETRMGLQIIYPRTGEPFNSELHVCDQNDVVLTVAGVQHDTIHVMKQLGFRTPASVLRRAHVARYLLDTNSLGDRTRASISTEVPEKSF